MGRYRTGWKISFMYVLFFGLTIGIGIWIGLFMNFAHVKLKLDSMTMMFGQELAEIGAVLLMVYVFEKDKMRRFGLPWPFKFGKELIYGILLGASSMIVIFLVFRGLGYGVLERPLSDPHFSFALVWLLILMILVGFGEEMMTRGYTLSLLERQIGKKWVSIGVSSLIFACLHLMNPHVSLLAFVNLVLFAVVAAFMYLRSGSLWLPIAYHATWDYFEGNVFGFPNSGNVTPSLYTFDHVTPNLVTGGGFGPEGGVVVTGLLLVTLFWTLVGYRPKRTMG